MTYIFPYIFCLIYWVFLLIVIQFPHTVGYLTVATILWWGIGIWVVAGKAALKYWNVWFNFLLYLVSSVWFTLILSSPFARNAYSIVTSFIIGVLVYALSQFSRESRSFIAKVYLEFINFSNVITFWQIFVLLYFVIISYDISRWYALGIALPSTFLLTRGSFTVHTLSKSSPRLVTSIVSLTTLEFFVALELLPLHYFALATLLTVWFFFIMDMIFSGQEVASRSKLFRVYTILALVCMVIIFATAQWGL